MILRPGGATVALGRGNGGLHGLRALAVEDFDTAVAELKAAGVRFDVEPFETPVCRMTIIRAPDGNRLCVHNRRLAK